VGRKKQNVKKRPGGRALMLGGGTKCEGRTSRQVFVGGVVCGEVGGVWAGQRPEGGKRGGQRFPVPGNGF